MRVSSMSLGRIPQLIIEDLANDSEYKFSVRAINKKGVSVESPFSNPVMVEKPLPSGW